MSLAGRSVGHRDAAGSSILDTCAWRIAEFLSTLEFATHRRTGWVVDHITPLACGGADDPSNMQWQTIDDARELTGGNAPECR
jgi:hypothetical protein